MGREKIENYEIAPPYKSLGISGYPIVPRTRRGRDSKISCHFEVFESDK